MPQFNNPALPRRPLRLIAGAIVALGIAGLVVLLLRAIAAAAAAQATSAGPPVDIAHLLRMTAIQAGLSTLLSCFARIENHLSHLFRPAAMGLFRRTVPILQARFRIIRSIPGGPAHYPQARLA